MTAPEVMALSMLVSIATGGLGLTAVAAVARKVGDPVLKDRIWSAAFWATALAPLLTVATLILPAPVRTVTLEATTAVLSAPGAPVMIRMASVSPAFTIDAALIAWTVLGLALATSIARLVALGTRSWRLRRLMAATVEPSVELVEAIAACARNAGTTPPTVRISHVAHEALLAGLFRPQFILPAGLAARTDEAGVRAVIAHEIAHLKRRDHLALWAEEGLLVILAFNPLTPLLRHHRAAAREEACDALALGNASAGERRAYAQSLIDALRSRTVLSAQDAPALTFTGTKRSVVMDRLKAVLNPAPAAGRRTRLTVLAAGLMVLGLAGAASFAVAAQREPQIVTVRVSNAASQSGQDGMLDAADGQPITLTDAPWLGAALDPIYKVIWPQACGYGSNADGTVFVHAGKGCTPGDKPDPVIRTLAGMSPSLAPRAAFMAVKAACDARRPVEVVYIEGHERRTASAVCAAPVAAPAREKDFQVQLTYDGVTLQPGDRIEVALVRREGDNAWRRSLSFDLTGQDGLPAAVTARVDPELFRGGRSPSMKATLYSQDGTVRAVSADRQLPMLVSADSALAKAVLTSVEASRSTAESAAVESAQAATANLTPQQRARYFHPTAEQYQALCRSSADGDDGFCAGVLFSQLPAESENTHGICPPTGENGAWDAARIGREGRRAVADVRISPGMSTVDLARTALQTAYPCPADQG
ncbi:hypothetical protein BH10PSE1_BH10PSE1_25660 [soil metagenome]